jgi:hypothetical protein
LLYATFGLCSAAICYSKCESRCVGCGNIQIIVEEWHLDGISLAWIDHCWQWVHGDLQRVWAFVHASSFRDRSLSSWAQCVKQVPSL